MLFPALKKNLVYNKKFRGGGGGGVDFFFFRKQLFLISLFNTKKNIEKCPFTYWLNGRWFLQIVERDSWNLYPLISSIPLLNFVF